MVRETFALTKWIVFNVPDCASGRLRTSDKILFNFPVYSSYPSYFIFQEVLLQNTSKRRSGETWPLSALMRTSPAWNFSTFRSTARLSMATTIMTNQGNTLYHGTTQNWMAKLCTCTTWMSHIEDSTSASCSTRMGMYVMNCTTSVSQVWVCSIQTWKIVVWLFTFQVVKHSPN